MQENQQNARENEQHFAQEKSKLEMIQEIPFKISCDFITIHESGQYFIVVSNNQIFIYQRINQKKFNLIDKLMPCQDRISIIQFFKNSIDFIIGYTNGGLVVVRKNIGWESYQLQHINGNSIQNILIANQVEFISTEMQMVDLWKFNQKRWNLYESLNLANITSVCQYQKQNKALFVIDYQMLISVLFCSGLEVVAQFENKQKLDRICFVTEVQLAAYSQQSVFLYEVLKDSIQLIIQVTPTNYSEIDKTFFQFFSISEYIFLNNGEILQIFKAQNQKIEIILSKHFGKKSCLNMALSEPQSLVVTWDIRQLKIQVHKWTK